MSNRTKLVSVVGSGSLAPDSFAYELAYNLGAEVMKRGYVLVTGGRGGVMEAASRGARESDAWSAGRIVGLLPGASPDDGNRWADILFPTGLGDLRNGLVARAHAVIGVEGGAGTLSEMALAWKFDRLVVGMRAGGWAERLADATIDSRRRYDFEDRVFGADTAPEALDIVDERVDRYDSWART